MTYGLVGQEQIFEKERGEVAAAAESGLAIDDQRLLPDGPLARVPKLCDFLMSETLELEQRHVPLGRRQSPPIELPVDGRPQSLEHALRLFVPPPRIVAPAPGFGLGPRQLDVEAVRSMLRRRHLPPVERDAAECRQKDDELE